MESVKIPVLNKERTHAVFLDPKSDILYFEKVEHDVIYHTIDQVYYAPKNQGDWNLILKEWGYLVIDQGSTVNPNHPIKFLPEKQAVSVLNGNVLSVSRSKLKKVKEVLGENK